MSTTLETIVSAPALTEDEAREIPMGRVCAFLLDGDPGCNSEADRHHAIG
jgi:hypothetical protein